MHDGTMHGRHIDQIQYTHLGAATADNLVEQMIRLEALQHEIDQLQCVQIGETQQQLLESLQQLPAGAEELQSLRIVALRHVAGKVIDQGANASTHADHVELWIRLVALQVWGVR